MIENSHIELGREMTAEQISDAMSHPEKYMNKATEQTTTQTTPPETVTTPQTPDTTTTTETTTTQTPPETTFNWREIPGSRFETEEAYKSFLSEYDTLKIKASEWETKSREYETKLNEQVNPFANEKIFKINHLVKTGVDDTLASRIVSADLDSMNPIDRLVLHEVMKNPKYASKEHLIRADLEDTYGTLDSSDPDLSDEDKRKIELNKFRLERDADDAAAEIKKMRDGIEVPRVDIEAMKVERDKQQADLRAGWTTVVSEFLKSRTAIPLPTLGADGKEVKAFMDFTLTDDLKKDYDKQLVDFAVNNNVPLTEEGFAQIAGVFDSQFVLNNLPRLIHSAVTKAKEMSTEEWRKYTHNPSALENKDVQPDIRTKQQETNAETEKKLGLNGV